MANDKCAESDAEILAQAKIYMRADRYVWRSTKPPPKTQDFMAWLDAALRFIDDRDATIAAQTGQLALQKEEIERLNGMLGDVGRELDDQAEEIERLRHRGCQYRPSF